MYACEPHYNLTPDIHLTHVRSVFSWNVAHIVRYVSIGNITWVGTCLTIANAKLSAVQCVPRQADISSYCNSLPCCKRSAVSADK